MTEQTNKQFQSNKSQLHKLASEKTGLNKGVLDGMKPLTKEQIEELFHREADVPPPLTGGIILPVSNFDATSILEKLAELEARIKALESSLPSQ